MIQINNLNLPQKYKYIFVYEIRYFLLPNTFFSKRTIYTELKRIVSIHNNQTILCLKLSTTYKLLFLQNQYHWSSSSPLKYFSSYSNFRKKRSPQQQNGCNNFHQSLHTMCWSRQQWQIHYSISSQSLSLLTDITYFRYEIRNF